MTLKSIEFSDKNKTIIKTFDKDKLDLFIFVRDSMIVTYPEVDKPTNNMLKLIIESSEDFSLKLIEGLEKYINSKTSKIINQETIDKLIDDKIASKLSNL